MTAEEALKIISLGETSTVQFKEIARLFQQSGMMYADELVVPDTGEADIDKEKVEEYLSQLSPGLSGGTAYRDSRNITGTIPKLFKEGMNFFNANLLRKQRGQNFNSEGILEISPVALEELLQNALVHRDYSRNAPIRLAIFDNRVEIISPGKLPNSLTVESIKLGQAVVRNNLLRTYCSRFMIYRGFGSGITRALEDPARYRVCQRC